MSATTFAQLGVPDQLVRVLDQRGITEPFPIQGATIPDALAGRDVMGRAPTGSGKTLAFGLPLLTGLDRAQPKRPRALVLAPTRELAEQIRKELHPLAEVMKRKITAIYGGVSYNPQRSRLRQGVDILVATPGRLADLIEQRDVSLADVERVVIDEADRMSDMGFLPEVRRLLDMTRSARQTLLFSATLDGDVAVLTRDYQNDPARHDVAGADPDGSEARHFFWRVEHQDRVDHTARLITSSSPTVVFTRTRHGADRLARQLERSGVSAAAIHGGRNQNQRDRALRDFSNGRVKALIATDVAARGIHVDGVASVVHYDPPDGFKTYLHRSGRTARAGATGVVVSLVVGDQMGIVRGMQRDLGLDGRFDDPAPDGSTRDGGTLLGELPTHPGGNGGGNGGGGGRGNGRGNGAGNGRGGNRRHRPSARSGAGARQGGGDRSEGGGRPAGRSNGSNGGGGRSGPGDRRSSGGPGRRRSR